MSDLSALTRVSDLQTGDIVHLMRDPDGGGKQDHGLELNKLLAAMTAPRSVAPMLLFDGYTAGARAYCPLGAAGDIGTRDFTLIFESVEWPTANPSADRGIGGVGVASSALTTAGDLNVYLDGGTDDLVVELVGSKTATIDGLRMAFSGQTAALGLRRAAGVLTVWCGGVSQTLSEAGAGSFADSITAEYLVQGIRAAAELWSGRMGRALLIIGTLTDAEIQTHARTGRLPTWCHATSGVIAASTMLNNSFENSPATPPTAWTSQGNHTISSLADGTAPDGSNVAEVVASGAGSWTGNAVYHTNNPTRVVGAKYRVRFWAKSISANTTLRVGGNFGGSLTLTSEWAEYVSGQYTVVGPGTLTAAFYLEGAGTFRIDNVRFTSLGPIARHTLQPGAVVHPDDGANKLPLLLTSGVTAVGSTPNEVVIPGIAMTADGFVHADQVITPTGYELVAAYALQTGTATSTITVKETSSGGTTVATGALSASVTRVALTVSNGLLAGGKKLHLANSSWAGNTVTPFFVFRRAS